MTVNAALLVDRLRPVLARLVADLSVRAEDPPVALVLRDEHAAEQRARRTADPYEVWVGGRVVQIAAAWLLSLLFVRALEDRGLLPPRLNDGDHRELLRGLAPYLNDRDYLLVVFRELCRHRAVRDVFDPAHNPVWTLGPSADMASELLSFARASTGLGGLDLSGDTRFLGDVYERLDEGVRDRYALLQTPDFVERFILDRTLGPALDERGVNGLTLIDPTCGSGHFLLGAFQRLFQVWSEADPAAGPEVWAYRALGQVYGVDINPYAVAIARFRLVLAYLEAAGLRDLDAGRDLRVNVAVADSLRPVEGARQQDLGLRAMDPELRARWSVSPYVQAQGAEAQRVLGGRSFDVVVGNPPYITVKDAVLRDVYRELYKSAAGKYQLVVPFIERLFGLAKEGGWVGAIVGNAFMKREFGKKLIEEFLPTVDLTQVVDSSGAYIPGHGTPTVILFGRRRVSTSERVLAVLGKRGEPTTPDEPAEGQVWSSIRRHDREVGYDDVYISVDSLDRAMLAVHPWSLRGGGATALVTTLEQGASESLGDRADSIGITCFTLEDDIYVANEESLDRAGVEPDYRRAMVLGEALRDWAYSGTAIAAFPYDAQLFPITGSPGGGVMRYLWRARARLSNSIMFGGKTKVEVGLRWFEYGRLTTSKLQTPYAITFAFVATHNHFVLDRGGKVFKQSAPIIKLPPEATEDDHLALLGYLNSSTACFWMKQVFAPKGGSGIGRGIQPEAWMERYEFDGTKIRQFPLVSNCQSEVLRYARELDRTAGVQVADTVETVLKDSWSGAAELVDALTRRRTRKDTRLRRIVASQEALDWLVYAAYGLVDEDLWSSDLEERLPFDRVIDRRHWETVRSGESTPAWFENHGWQVDEVSRHFESNAPTRLDERRLAAIQRNHNLSLMECPAYKRRWYRPDYEAEERAALQTWLLTRLESELRASPEPHPRSVRRLARALHSDLQVRAVAEVLTNAADPDLEALLTDLAGRDAVPYLAAWRYKEPGLKKFRLWEQTWEAQRAEDAWEAADPATRAPARPAVPLPPAYDSGDFAKPAYWSLRGKLDVPKERFVSYPGLEDDDDPTPLLGWAGWDHADRMAALGHLLERHGGDPARVQPLLAGMLELLPWVEQWHKDDPRYGTPLGALWRGHIDGALATHRLSPEALLAWRPTKTNRGGRRRHADRPTPR